MAAGLTVLSKLDNLRLAAEENFDWKGWEVGDMVREGKMGGERKRCEVQNLYSGSCPVPRKWYGR